MIRIELDRSRLEVIYDAGQIVAVRLQMDMDGTNILPWLDLPTRNRIKTAAAIQLDRGIDTKRRGIPLPAGPSIIKETT